MSGRASAEVLDTLHRLTAKALIAKLESGEATAADISAASKFLKDNGVEAVPTPGSPLRKLAESLPFAGSDMDPHSPH